MLNLILRALLFLGMCAGIVFAFKVPDADLFSEPSLARIIFFHLPMAITCSIFLLAAAYFAVRHLMDKSLHWDLRSAASMELALVLGILTLATGILFSRMQWGAWWGWDPRQTSFLLVMLIVAAYFALRSSFPDEAKRAAIASAYALGSVLPILFLIFVYPRLPSTVSLHPETKFTTTFDPNYKITYWSIYLFMQIMTAWIYRLRVRASLLESESEKLYGEMANRDGSAATGVVRPVSLPSDRG